MTNRDDEQAGRTEAGGLAWAPYLLSVAVVVLGGYLGLRWWQVESRTWTPADAIAASDIGPPLLEFELTERNGQPFRSADMRGRVWVASYFFTTCPGACVQLNQNIKTFHNDPDLQDVTWVSITCDPDNDTLDALRQYAEHYQADPQRWLFCRGELDYIKQVGRGMGVEVYRQSHKTFVVVVDRQGDIRGVYDAVGDRLAQERLKQRLRELIDEPDPA